uniref:Carboxypeptidase n=1 Tax=Rhizophora mucronata TaxID=61149 RepID=A0A2P2KR10_RHIMU
MIESTSRDKAERQTQRVKS